LEVQPCVPVGAAHGMLDAAARSVVRGAPAVEGHAERGRAEDRAHGPVRLAVAVPLRTAGLDSTLEVEDLTTGRTATYRLVEAHEAAPTKGLISTTSPIGRALINKEPGDNVKVATPGGTREFEIIKLITIHDEAE